MFSRLDILGFWNKCQLTRTKIQDAKEAAEKIISFKEMYDDVEAHTGVPWYGVGTKDYREPYPAFDHTKYLGNGDPLNRKTVHVPEGRGPFASWSAGAIDAIHDRGWDRLPTGGHWDIVTLLIKDEAFNGMGYAHMGLRSPYVWGGTNMQQIGKYEKDHRFDPRHWDTQLGTAAIYLALKQFHNIDLGEA